MTQFNDDQYPAGGNNDYSPEPDMPERKINPFVKFFSGIQDFCRNNNVFMYLCLVFMAVFIVMAVGLLNMSSKNKKAIEENNKIVEENKNLTEQLKQKDEQIGRSQEELDAMKKLYEAAQTNTYSRHFFNVEEIKKFVEEDDTDTMKELKIFDKAYRLQVRAAQAGYLMTVVYSDQEPYCWLLALDAQGQIYKVMVDTDEVIYGGYFYDIPSFYPISPFQSDTNA